jgi:hypothetical protein
MKSMYCNHLLDNNGQWGKILVMAMGFVDHLGHKLEFKKGTFHQKKILEIRSIVTLVNYMKDGLLCELARNPLFH